MLFRSPARKTKAQRNETTKKTAKKTTKKKEPTKIPGTGTPAEVKAYYESLGYTVTARGNTFVLSQRGLTAQYWDDLEKSAEEAEWFVEHQIGIDDLLEDLADIEANVAKTFPIAMQYFDSKIAKPLPKPIVDVTSFCSQIQNNIWMTHFDTRILLGELCQIEPDVHVKSFCQEVLANACATHDLVFAAFDYYAGGHQIGRAHV